MRKRTLLRIWPRMGWLRAKLVECRICQDKDGDSNMETPCSSCGSLKEEVWQKIDIYDFSVILLEIISGRTIISQCEVDIVQASIAADEASWRSIVDPVVRRTCCDESLKTVMEICVRCLYKEPSQRLSIDDVLQVTTTSDLCCSLRVSPMAVTPLPGGKRLAPVGLGDDDQCIEDDFTAWRELACPELDQLLWDEDDVSGASTPYTTAIPKHRVVFVDPADASHLERNQYLANDNSIHDIQHPCRRSESLLGKLLKLRNERLLGKLLKSRNEADWKANVNIVI